MVLARRISSFSKKSMGIWLRAVHTNAVRSGMVPKGMVSSGDSIECPVSRRNSRRSAGTFSTGSTRTEDRHAASLNRMDAFPFFVTPQLPMNSQLQSPHSRWLRPKDHFPPSEMSCRPIDSALPNHASSPEKQRNQAVSLLPSLSSFCKRR